MLAFTMEVPAVKSAFAKSVKLPAKPKGQIGQNPRSLSGALDIKPMDAAC